MCQKSSSLRGGQSFLRICCMKLGSMHIHSSKDYVRFCATCKSWNLNLPKVPNHIRGPWLVLPFNHDTYEIEEEKDSSSYLRYPEMMQNNILLRGSSFGWLISFGIDGVIRMLNPLKKAHYFDLPPLSTFPTIVDYQPDLQDEEYTVMFYTLFTDSTYDGVLSKDEMQKIYLSKIIIFSPPSDDMQDDLVALAIYGDQYRLPWCKFGDTKWTNFSTPEIKCPNLHDVIFYEGKIYGVSWNAELYVFDVKTSIGGFSEVPKPDLHIYANTAINYLIRSVEGNLLLVVRYLKHHHAVKVEEEEDTQEIWCYKTHKFKVYKLEKSTKQWTRILSLGDYVLVVGYNSSVSLLPFSDSEGNWVRNSIYFTDNNIESQYRRIVGGHDVGVFNLEDGRIHQFFPKLQLLHPSPVWLFSQNSIC